MNITLILIKLGLLKVTKSRIQQWSKNKNLEVLKYAVHRSDFRCRGEIARNLSKFEFYQVEATLRTLMHDKVKTVAKATIATLKKYDLSDKLEAEIEIVLEKWKRSEGKTKENWSKSDSFFHGLYIDKSKM